MISITTTGNTNNGQLDQQWITIALPKPSNMAGDLDFQPFQMEAGKDPGEIRDVPSGNDSQFAIENGYL